MNTNAEKIAVIAQAMEVSRDDRARAPFDLLLGLGEAEVACVLIELVARVVELEEAEVVEAAADVSAGDLVLAVALSAPEVLTPSEESTLNFAGSKSLNVASPRTLMNSFTAVSRSVSGNICI
jgi:hypothetical protein